MAMVDPHTGKIIKADTVLVDGVECLPKFDPRKLTYEPKQEHPLYATTNNVIGAKKPCVFDVPTNYLCAAPPPPRCWFRSGRNRCLAGGCLTRPAPARRPTSQEFSNTFSIGESTNKRTVMFKDNGLSTSVTRSKVHSSLDWGI